MSGITRYWWRWALGKLLVVGGAIGFSGNCALAQELKPIPDNTLGAESSLVTTSTSDSPVDVISGGAQRGANLFHSFREFNVGEGRGAYFYSRSADIQNILARVTGSNPSKIFGTIGTYGNSNPNLFLINPKGIIFGPNASLDMGNAGLNNPRPGGSFVATTANAIRLGDNGIFSASEPAKSNLLTVNPSALFFNAISRQEIVNQSTATNSVLGWSSNGLQVPGGRSLLLVGGDVRVDGGKITASGGRVELGGVAGQGTVGLNIDGNNVNLNFPIGVGLADVSLTNGASGDVKAGGGGSIAINAQNLNLVRGSTLVAGIGQGLGSVGSQAGDITLNGTEAVTVADSSYIFNIVESGAIGNAGDINITTGSLSVTNGAQLQSLTGGRGNAANVNINARDTVLFDAVSSDRYFSGAYSTVERGAIGDAGNINITAGSLSMKNGARLSASTSGQGNGGRVNILARDQVSFDGVGSNGLPSTALSNVEIGAIGNAGDINVKAGSLYITNGAQLESRSRGRGNAANVNINVGDTVTFDGVGSYRWFSGAYSTVERGAIGDAGNINITAGSLSMKNGARLSAGTSGQGNGGNVIINASKNASFDSSTIFNSVGQTGEGKGGDIHITTGELSVINGAQLQASTDGKGDAGSVIIYASKSVSFDRVWDGMLPSAAFSGVGVGGEGKGGDIHITTGELSVTNGAQLQASTGGIGDSGNVIINASKSVSFDGVIIGKYYTFNSYAASRVYDNAQGKGGNIHITTGELSLTNGAQVFADTSGKGDAGNIQINAKNSVSVSGTSLISGSSSALFTSTNSTDKGGNIIVNTSAFRTLDGGVLNAQTFNDGDGGSITVRAKLVEVLNGGQLLATSSGNGRAGNITVNAADQVIVNGSDATYLDRVEKFGTKLANAFGTKGVNNVDADSGLFVRSQSLGSAGNIEVISPQIRLDNSGKFIAESASGNGGNITLGVRDLLLLRRGSLISATAGTEKQVGNGGNITINAPSGFLVAVPNENSDITANAYTGRGGRVKIKASGIYGIEFRDQENSQSSDITASSTFGTNGTVELNTPGIDPNSGLVNLPTVPLDSKVSQVCQPRTAENQSSFIITGRGGLPPNPRTEPLSGDAVQVDWVTLKPRGENRASTNVSKPTSPTPAPIVEAQGWVRNAKGEVVLTAYAPTATPHSSWLPAASCP